MNPLEKVTAIVLVFFALPGVYLLVMECVEAQLRYIDAKGRYERARQMHERYVQLEREITTGLAELNNSQKRKPGRPRKTP